MLTADDVRAQFSEAIHDQLQICAELIAVGVELSAIERRYGVSPDTIEVRREQQRVCATVLEQLRVLMFAADAYRVH